MKQNIVVIGGGMAGTAAAQALVKRGYAVTIVEKDARLGGRIRSETIGDLTSEMGAGFLTDAYVNTLAFVRQTGLGAQLQERKSTTAIVRNGTPHSLSNLATLLGNSWLSLGAKLRLVAEVVSILPVWRSLGMRDMRRVERFDGQSIAEHLHGKYGRELVDYLIAPAIDSYCYWSPQRTSRAFFMAFLKDTLVRRHTYILKGGLSQIPKAAAQGSTVLLSCDATAVTRKPNGKYEVSIQDAQGKRTLEVDGVVCATTASVVPKIVKNLSRKQAGFFSAIHYSSTAVVTYRLPRDGAPATRAVAYPRPEGLPIAAMTVSSDLSPVADAVKLYASGTVGKELCAKSDAAIASVLSDPAGLDASAAHKTGEWRVRRWHEA